MVETSAANCRRQSGRARRPPSAGHARAGPARHHDRGPPLPWPNPRREMSNSVHLRHYSTTASAFAKSSMRIRPSGMRRVRDRGGSGTSGRSETVRAHRQLHGERRALHRHRSAVSLHDRRDDRESEPRPGPPGAARPSPEALEQPLMLGWVRAGTLVANRQPGPPARDPELDVNRSHRPDRGRGRCRSGCPRLCAARPRHRSPRADSQRRDVDSSRRRRSARRQPHARSGPARPAPALAVPAPSRSSTSRSSTSRASLSASRCRSRSSSSSTPCRAA